MLIPDHDDRLQGVTRGYGKASAGLSAGLQRRDLLSVGGLQPSWLGAAERQELLADYLPWTEVVAVPEPPPRVPDCRDVHDLPFLHLAAAGRADALVTGDADLLALAAPTTRPRLRFRVLTVQAFLDGLAPPSA